jgi:DNA-binding SARP family transcriptional activator
MYIESSLQLGKHREMVSELVALVAEHPLREAFCRQLMLALYRSERQADALQVYRATRDMLNQELGVEPGRALRQLQQAILTADRNLDFDAGCAPSHTRAVRDRIRSSSWSIIEGASGA